MPYTLLTPALYNLEVTTTTASFSTIVDVSTPASGQAFTLPPNTITTVGQTLILRASGVWGCTGTPTFGLGFYYGGQAGVTLAATAATGLTTGAGTISNIPWWMEWWGTAQAVGTSGSLLGGGSVHWGTSATALSDIPFASPQTAATVNTTLPKSIVIGGICSASNASNTILVQQFSILLAN